jgi:plastocyanin
VTAIVLAVTALAFSIPALLLASSARNKAQSAEDQVGSAVGSAQATPPTVPSTVAPTTSAAPTTPCPASAGLGSTVSDHGATPATGSRLSIEAADLYFVPTCITQVPPGSATLVVHNRGQALHNVSIPNQGINKDVAPGKTITLLVKVGGDPVQFFCKYHKTSGMVGALVPSP